jgi:uncharacterized membrane protein YecN with MAPEG domain
VIAGPASFLYAGLLGLLLIALSVQVVRARMRFRVGLGTGTEEGMQQAVRVHANFAEYVPLSLLLIYFAEAASESALFTHSLCVTLLCSRLLHAYGVSRVRENYRYRTIGMVLTFLVIVSASLFLLCSRLP